MKFRNLATNEAFEETHLHRTVDNVDSEDSQVIQTGALTLSAISIFGSGESKELTSLSCDVLPVLHKGSRNLKSSVSTASLSKTTCLIVHQ